jgi:hypothetical protein
MKHSIVPFTYGAIVGLAIVETFAGEWRAVVCAVVGLIMIRLATQGAP